MGHQPKRKKEQRMKERKGTRKGKRKGIRLRTQEGEKEKDRQTTDVSTFEPTRLDAHLSAPTRVGRRLPVDRL